MQPSESLLSRIVCFEIGDDNGVYFEQTFL